MEISYNIDINIFKFNNIQVYILSRVNTSAHTKIVGLADNIQTSY